MVVDMIYSVESLGLSKSREERQLHMAMYVNGGNKQQRKRERLSYYHVFGTGLIEVNGALLYQTYMHLSISFFQLMILIALQQSHPNYGLRYQERSLKLGSHARFSPSASKRWLACPGSIQLSESIPYESNTTYAAASGTYVHSMVEMLLEGNLENVTLRDYWLGRKEQVEDFEVEVTEDMISCAEQYVNYVEGRVKELNGRLLIEQKLHIEEISPECFGTGDAIILGKETNRIAVIDLKSGKFPVEVEHNEQLMIYGLGACSRYADENTTIELTIVQPLGFHKDGPIRSWDISASDLVDWGFNVLKPGIEACLEKEPVFNAGVNQCKFCSAKSVCETYKNKE